MARIALITSRFPYPLEKGDKLRAYHHLRILSEKHKVVLYALCDKTPTDEQLEALDFCDHIYSYPIGKWTKFWGLIWSLFKGWPFQVGYFYSRDVVDRLRGDVLKESVDHIHVHMIRSHPYLVRGIKSSIDYMDAMSASFQAVGQNMGGLKSLFYRWEASRLRRFEQRIAAQYDHKMIISSRDAEHIDVDPMIIVANGIDLSYYQKRASINSEKPYVLFLGNLGYIPNAQAVKEFIAVAVKCPDLKFKIYGARAEQVQGFHLPQNCTIEGWIEDSREAYSGALCLYAPIHTGAGQQNKVLEAMAMGVPVVTTSFVQAGIQAVHGRDLIVADNKDAARRAIQNLRADIGLQDQLATQGRTFVEENFDWTRASQPLLNKI